MYYEWRLGLLALVFTPFILIATYLQRKVMVSENLGTRKSMEASTKVRNILVYLVMEASFGKNEAGKGMHSKRHPGVHFCKSDCSGIFHS